VGPHPPRSPRGCGWVQSRKRVAVCVVVCVCGGSPPSLSLSLSLSLSPSPFYTNARLLPTIPVFSPICVAQAKTENGTCTILIKTLCLTKEG
jgi:hypothetical protein